MLESLGAYVRIGAAWGAGDMQISKLLCYKGSGSIQCSPEVEPIINQMLFKQNSPNANFLEVWAAGGHQKLNKNQNISD